MARWQLEWHRLENGDYWAPGPQPDLYYLIRWRPAGTGYTAKFWRPYYCGEPMNGWRGGLLTDAKARAQRHCDRNGGKRQ